MKGKGNRIVQIDVHRQLEKRIERYREKYTSDLWTMATYLVGGYQGVGGVVVLRDLEKRHPDEYRELEEITRKALVAAEEPEVYQLIPQGYVLDRSDPDVLVLRREDGGCVAAFSSTGVTSRGILDAVKEDRRRRGRKDLL